MATKKITAKTVKTLPLLWRKYINVKDSEGSHEQHKEAEDAYYTFKKENFDDCTEIEDDAVMEMLKEPYQFILPSVNKISLIALKLIGSSDIYSLELNGFEEFTDEQTDALSGLANKSRNYRCRNLRFDSLKKLNTGFYFAFYKFKNGGDLKLNGITELTEGEQKAVSKFKFSNLELNNLKSISPNGFKQFKGILSLGSLEDIPADVAEGMKKWKMGGIHLRNLKKISVEFAKSIAERTDQPYITFGCGGKEGTDKNGRWIENGKTYGPELSLESMTELMKGRYGRISFNGITDLTPEIAAILNKNPALIDLKQLVAATMNQDAYKALTAKFPEKYCNAIYCSDVSIDRVTGRVDPTI